MVELIAKLEVRFLRPDARDDSAVATKALRRNSRRGSKLTDDRCLPCVADGTRFGVGGRRLD